jgi:uncharacterized membrane protein
MTLQETELMHNPFYVAWTVFAFGQFIGWAAFTLLIKWMSS